MKCVSFLLVVTKFIIEQADAQPLLYTFTESRYSSKHTLKHSYLIRCCEDYRPYTCDKETKTEVKLFVQPVQILSVPVSI